MTIFCATCRASFPAESENIIYDNGTDLAVFKCDKCGTHYLAAADEHKPVPVLFKLAKTKSYVINKEQSQIIKPQESRLIVTPAEAVAEMRRKR